MNESTFQALTEYIKKVAEKIVRGEGSSNVVSGNILSVLPGEYEVQLINGENTSPIKATSLNESQSFKKDDTVFLISSEFVSGGISETKYFIFGLVSVVQENYAQLTDWERFEAIEDAQYETTGTIYVFENGDKEITTIDSTAIGGQQVINALKINGWLAVAATFNLPEDVVTTFGNYGLRFDFYNGDQLIESQNLDTGWFVGQAYKLRDSKQHRVIHLGEKAASVNKIKVSAFSIGFNSGVYTNDFYVKDLIVQVGKLIEIFDNFSVSIERNGAKDYFYKDLDAAAIDEKNTVSLKAIAKYNNQILSSDSLKYYWFVENDEVTDASSDGFSFVGGPGWYCLNDFEYPQINNDGNISEDTSIKIWNTTQQHTFTIGEDKLVLFKKYKNKVKCVVGYQLNNFTSNELEIINLNNEAFYAELSSNDSSNLLIQDEDEIVLTCNVKNENPISNNTFFCEWYQNENKIDEAIKDENEQYKSATLTINSSFFSQEVEKNTFFCRVYVNELDLEHLVAVTNKIIITSVIQKEKQLNSIKKIYYLARPANDNDTITPQFNLTQVNQGSGTPPAPNNYTKYTYFVGESIRKGNFKEYAKNFNELKTDNDIFSDTTKQYYLYYCTQEILVEEINDVTITELKYYDWTEPKLLRWVKYEGSDWVDLLTDRETEQFNTFNNLTRGGRDQGIFYDKDSEFYFITDDISPQDGKTYYTSNGNEYNQFEGTAFEDGIVYYERGNTNLYINASMIRTGALQIGEGLKEKFYASINNPTVRIGGFNVTENGLTNNDDVELTNTHFKAGDGIEATKTENGWQTTIKGSITFVSSQGEESSLEEKFEELQTNIDNIGTVESLYNLKIEGEFFGLNKNAVIAENTTSKIYLYEGNTILDLSNATPQNGGDGSFADDVWENSWEKDLGDKGKFKIKITSSIEENFVFNVNVTQSYFTTYLDMLWSSAEKTKNIIVTAYKDDEQIASSQITYSILNDGESPSYRYILASKQVINTDDSSNNKKITFTQYEKIGNNTPVLKSEFFYSTGGSNTWDWQKVEDSSFEYTYTESYGSNKTFSFSTTRSEYGIFDKITITTVKNGLQGIQGIQGPSGPEGLTPLPTELYYSHSSNINMPEDRPIVNNSVVNNNGWETATDFFQNFNPKDNSGNRLYVWKLIKYEYYEDNDVTKNIIALQNTTPVLLSDAEMAEIAASYWEGDLGSYASRIGAWCAEKEISIIDGSSIYTGSIDADKISVNDLLAFQATIGGWHINENAISDNELIANSEIGMSPGYQEEDGEFYCFWAGGPPASAPFSVTQGGYLKTTSGTIGGWDINGNAISNDPTATNSTVGMSPALAASSENYCFWAGGYPIKTGTNMAKFKVTTTGKVYCTDIDIAATNATEGTTVYLNSQRLHFIRKNNSNYFSAGFSADSTIGGVILGYGTEKPESIHNNKVASFFINSSKQATIQVATTNAPIGNDSTNDRAYFKIKMDPNVEYIYSDDLTLYGEYSFCGAKADFSNLGEVYFSDSFYWKKKIVTGIVEEVSELYLPSNCLVGDQNIVRCSNSNTAFYAGVVNGSTNVKDNKVKVSYSGMFVQGGLAGKGGTNGMYENVRVIIDNSEVYIYTEGKNENFYYLLWGTPNP